MQKRLVICSTTQSGWGRKQPMCEVRVGIRTRSGLFWQRKYSAHIQGNTAHTANTAHLLLVHDDCGAGLADVLLEGKPHQVQHRHPQRQAAQRSKRQIGKRSLYSLSPGRACLASAAWHCQKTMRKPPSAASSFKHMATDNMRKLRRSTGARGAAAGRRPLNIKVLVNVSDHRINIFVLTCTSARGPAAGRRPPNPQSPCPAAPPGAPAAAAPPPR